MLSFVQNMPVGNVVAQAGWGRVRRGADRGDRVVKASRGQDIVLQVYGGICGRRRRRSSGVLVRVRGDVAAMMD